MSCSELTAAASRQSVVARDEAGAAARWRRHTDRIGRHTDQLEKSAEAAWEHFVEAHPAGDVVQTAAWGRSKAAMGFRTAIATSHTPDGELEGGGLVVARRVALLGGRLPLLTVGYVARGPLVTGDDPARIDRVLDALERTARQLGVAHLVVQPAAGGEAVTARLTARGYDAGAVPVAPVCTLVLDLEAELDDLIAGMSSSQRRNLRKAKKLGVQVRRADEADLETFHALQVATAERQGYPPLTLAYLQAQWRALRPLGAAEIFLASTPEAPQRPIAGTLVTAYAGTVVDKVPGWTGEAAALNPKLACIWAAISWAKSSGFRRFDLGGLDCAVAAAVLNGERATEEHGERNPAAFKLRFGGRVLILPEARQRTLNPVLRPAVRFAWQQLAGNRRLKSFINGLRNG